MIIEHPGPVVQTGSRDPLPANWRELEAKAGPLPENLKVVVPGKVYRSGIVFAHQVPNLQRELGIRHVIALLPGDWLDSLRDDPTITIHKFSTDRRHELRVLSRILEITDFIHDLKEPALVICKHGADRTGSVVGAFRVRQGENSLVAALKNVWSKSYQLGTFLDVAWRYRNLPRFNDAKNV